MFGPQPISIFPVNKSSSGVLLFMFIVANLVAVAFTYVLLRAKKWKYTVFLGLCLATAYNGVILYTFIHGMIAA